VYDPTSWVGPAVGTFGSVRTSRLPSRTVRLAVALVALAVPLVACGGDSATKAPSDCTPVVGAKFTMIARNIQWNTDCLKVVTGSKVQFTVELEDEGVKHDLQIYGQTTREKTPLAAGPVTLSLLAPFPYEGVYHYVCSIHANMEGTIYAQDQ